MWALVLAIASFVVCPVLAAIAALVASASAARQIRASGGTLAGSGLVTGARVVAAANLVLVPLAVGAVALLGGSEAWRSFSEGFEEGWELPVAADLRVGECFDMYVEDSAGADLELVVETWSCDEPHDAEVVGVERLAESASYPGRAEVKVAGRQACLALFAEYVGEPWEESELELVVFTPTDDQWDDPSMRKVVCAASRSDEHYIEGSVAADGGGRPSGVRNA